MIAQPVETPRALRLLAEAPPLAGSTLAIGAPEKQPHHVGLIGRERELAVLSALVEHAPETGSAMLIRGAPGTGKSALVEALVEDIRVQPIAVLRASGIRAEASLPYAGLHQLLRPILGELGSLPRPQRRAIEIALGMTTSPPPDPFLIAIATLDLLSIAARAGLLIVVEDAHWLDRQTTTVLSFVARRLSSDPIVLLVTARDDRRSPILDAGMTALQLEPLGDDQAAQLLATARPRMAASVQQRLIQVAAGNPLALMELPATLSSEQLSGEAALPETLPLTARLQHAVGARTRELPVVTRRLLRLLAHHGGGEVTDLLGAYEALYPGEPVAPDALLPAVVAGTVVLYGRIATFRDQLVRTAVYQGTSAADRRSAYAALAAARLAQASRHAEVAPHPLDDGETAQQGDPGQERPLVSDDPTHGDSPDPSTSPDDPWLAAISAVLGSADPASITEVASRYEGRDVATSDLLPVGIAAAIGGDVARSRVLLARAAPVLTSDDDRPLLAKVLVMQAWNDIHLGRWDDAPSEVAEGALLARETGQTTWSVVADVAGALLAAMRGDEEAVDVGLANAGSAAAARGQGLLASSIEVVRGISDLNVGRADAAYTRLRDRLTSTDGDAFVWAVDHFADAALLTRNVEEARAILAARGDAAAEGRGPLHEAGLVYAGAVLAEDPTADERQTLAIEELAPWPIHQARLQLHRGAWLRRHRRVADSRAPLRAARDLFEALGAAQLAERARHELRASGERIRQRDITAWDQLSPQESEIANMAAQGLSNREIGAQLFLSHRTVGAHLYRIFPKLGVTSRGQLHRVLATADPDQVAGVRPYM